MAAITVLIRVENRDIILELEDNSYFTLEKSFLDHCKSDPALTNRLKVFAPIFKSKNPIFGNFVAELVKHHGLTDKQHIIVDWCALEIQPTDIRIGQNVAHSSCNRIAPNAAETLPLRTVSDPSFEAVKDWYSIDEWSNLSSEERINEKSRLERFKLLQSMAFLPQDAVFTKCSSTEDVPKKGQKSGVASRVRKNKTTENAGPTRKSSRKRVCRIVDEDENTENVDDDLLLSSVPKPNSSNETPLASTSTNSTPTDEGFIESQVLQDDEEDFLIEFMQKEELLVSQTSNTNESGPREASFSEEIPDILEPSCSADSNKENIDPKMQKPPRKKREELPREFGKYITEFNAMPDNISEELHKAITLNKHNPRTLMTLIKEHIRAKIGLNRYPKSHEYKLVCTALIAKYPTLADTDNPTGYEDLKYKIRKSLSGESHRERLAEFRKTLTEETLSQATTSNTGSAANSAVQEEVDVYIDELKRGAVTDSRTLFLIRKTLGKRQEFLNLNKNMDLCRLEAFIKEYPHYMRSEMLLYEYSLMLSETSQGKIKDLNTLQSNAAQMLKLVGLHINNTNQVETINYLQDKLVPEKFKKESVMSLFTVKHIQEVQEEVGALGTTQQYHSPCVLVLVDNRDKDGKLSIVKSYLKMNKGTISIIGHTTLKTVILQVMAPYFLFGLNYPPAYENLLRFFEKFVHGFFCESTEKSRAKKEYKKLMDELVPKC